MGIFNRIFRRKKAPEPEVNVKSTSKKLRLEEVDMILIEKNAGLVSEFNENVIEYRTKFTEDFNDLMVNFDKLDKAHIQKMVLENHRDVTDIIKTSRAHYVQSSRKLLADAIMRIKTENEPEKIRDIAAATFDRLNSFSKQAQIILVSFKVEVKDIASSLRKLYYDLQDFDKIMEKDYSRIKQRDEMRQIAALLIKSRTTQRRANERVKTLEDEISSVSDKLEKLTSHRDNVLKSQDYMHYERLKDELEDILMRREKIFREVELQASGLEKTVKTYIHESRDINRSQAELVREMIREPRQIIEKFPVFEAGIKNIGKSAPKDEGGKGKKGKEKEKKKKKSSAEYAPILDSIRGLVAEAEKLAKKEGKLRNEVESSAAEKSVAEINISIKDLQATQRTLTEEKEECESTISKKHLLDQQKLEIYLSELIGQKVRVV